MNELIEKYHELMMNICRDFASKNPRTIYTADDYYQEAIVVLMGIVINEEYDITKSSFGTFLSVCIKNRFKTLTYNYSTPFSSTETMFRLMIKIQELENKNYTQEEILKELKINHTKYTLAKNLQSEFDVNSIDIPVIVETNINDFLDYAKNLLSKDEINLMNDMLKGLDIRTISKNKNLSYESVRMQIRKFQDRLDYIQERYNNETRTNY